MKDFSDLGIVKRPACVDAKALTRGASATRYPTRATVLIMAEGAFLITGRCLWPRCGQRQPVERSRRGNTVMSHNQSKATNSHPARQSQTSQPKNRRLVKK